ncbi:3'(2'),5'-bisphosphate nucleotidase [Photobacterium gaetbulicola]|uniref:3'(2'),5'-bisphosphate nucleotidase CysQ n=1 Tax=Photobacterium gaetbulicola Gung47 TaxID=658445 RepID=A0A0C5WKL1_9GAMM|nr:3'(2'),5'-bisphosphate nucleotidase CysQ [Photobacterium gaetbulicola]AJR06777.1 putative sulfite synthesis pathway protein [Photobacterium gaetbulicola Gung47]PSU01482.1 3'(2'),5'-bisphosphate nucleotidase [Photobacterium gaetbulicola]
MGKQLESLYQIALEAGEAIMALYHSHVEVSEKDDRSPVTAADLAANAIILDKLAELTPDIPIVSEESAHIPWSERRNWQRFWLVDPLDGTKEYLRKNGEFTVNIALIEQGSPVMAVVHAPALGKTWLGDGHQAWLVSKNKREEIKAKSADKPVVVGSRSHPSPMMEEFLSKLPVYQLVAVGSSLKFCLVAEGGAQYYPRLGPTMMWDTAAGQCIAESAGAKVKALDGMPLRYDREELLNPHFIVSLPS